MSRRDGSGVFIGRNSVILFSDISGTLKYSLGGKGLWQLNVASCCVLLAEFIYIHKALFEHLVFGI